MLKINKISNQKISYFSGFTDEYKFQKNSVYIKYKYLNVFTVYFWSI